MELGPRLQLHPADPLVLEEDRGQPEPAPALLHHFGGGTHVGVEAHTEVGQLRLEGGRGDQAGIAPAHQPSGGVPGRVVRPGLGLDRFQGPSAQDGPHPPGQQPEHQGQHHQDDQRHQGGDDQLVADIGRVGVEDGPGGQPRPQVPGDPRGDRHPQQAGHDEGDQPPPGVAAQAPVERAGDDEPGQGRGVAQAVEADQPRRILVGPGGQRPPSPAGRGVADHPGLGVGGRVELGLQPTASRRVGVLARLDPDHPGPGGGAEVEVDRPGRLHAPGDDAGHRFGIGVEAGLVGAGLADDPSLVDGEEPGQGLVQGGVGLDRATGLGHGSGTAGEVEEVAGDDEYARAVPGVEGPGQLGGDGQGRRGGLGGEQEVADHHDPPSQGHVHPDGPGLGGEPRGHGAPAEALQVDLAGRWGGRSHGPSIVEAHHR